MVRARDTLVSALVFTALTIAMTWPQAAHLWDRVEGHFDSYFSMWRLAWIAHQLPMDPARLFEANVFHPQRNALALSDPILLQGVCAAPLAWLGASPVLAYNVLVLASFVLCGLAAWALAARLTGSSAAGVVAGIVFAFAPYRYEHYFHLEILWGFWIPLGFLALHRAVESGTVRSGLHAGAILVAQALSCLYYAVYLGVTMALAGVLLVRWHDRDRRRVIGGLALGAAAAMAATLLYVQPLLQVRRDLEPRDASETRSYSATATSYLGTPDGNRLYGRALGRFGAAELRLFPGAAAMLLAAAGAWSWRSKRIALVYLALLAVAVVGSFGMNAPFFRLGRGAFDLLSMLRVPARFAAVGLCALSVLAAMGTAALLRALGTVQARRVAVALVCAAMLAEYSTALNLKPVPPAGQVHAWLASQPRGVVAELPFPPAGALPGPEPYRQYFSTVHWQPLINGYSGYYPIAYIRLLVQFSVFPRGDWIGLLLGRGTTYFVLHEREMPAGDLMEARRRLDAHPGVALVGRLPDSRDPVWIYRAAPSARPTAAVP